MRRISRLVRGIRRVIPEPLVLDEMPQDIDAKTIDPALEPEAQYIMHGRDHFRIAPIEIGLLL
jgi:hypothetical protein